MTLKQATKNFINRLPYVRGIYQENIALKVNSIFRPGEFYSPVISINDIKNRQAEIWKEVKAGDVAGIDFNTAGQISLLAELAEFYPAMPFTAEKQDACRYYFENIFYSYTDATVLHTMMRHFAPKRIIEVGSGFSSAVMLDTRELFFNGQPELTFIDPYPERLYSLLRQDDLATTKVIEKTVQSVPLDHFLQLEAGDFLFIDSSHVVKTGSDVHHLFFNILPYLQKGVIIHFHDIFFAFEYPKEWVLSGQNWNENYFLRALMMYNKTFELLLFSDYIHKFHAEAFAAMPLCYKNTGGNCWLRKNT